jgi:hypothetical protein
MEPILEPILEPTEGQPAGPIPEPPTTVDEPRGGIRPGTLTPHWTTTFWLGWAGVAGGLVAVWYSSRVTGLATWWLGPEAEPRFLLVSLLPFVAPLCLCVLALSHRRWLPHLGIVGAMVTAVVGLVDLGRVRGYGAIELVLAAAGLALSVASFAGMLRRDPTPAG